MRNLERRARPQRIKNQVTPPHLQMACDCLSATRAHRIIATETAGAVEPNIFTIWPFMEQVCWPFQAGGSFF